MDEYGAGWWRQLLGWRDTALFSIGTSPVTVTGLLRVLLIVAVAWALSRIVRSALDRIAGHWPGMNRASLYALGRVAHYLLLALGVLIGLATIGVDFTNLALLLSALGVGIGFGLQSMAANFVAGIIILFERHLKVGDFVELESGVTGEVREIRMRATRITTNDNIDILVPNSEFVNGRVINWTLDEAFRRIHVPFGVAYGSDKDKVRTVVLEATDRVPYTLKGIAGRAPQVWFVKFGDSSLDFELIVWLTPEAVKRPSAVQAAYLWEIHGALEQHGIEVPFPQRDLHVRSVLGLKGEAARAWMGQRSVTPPDQETR
jgi:small-conductance mechanosensitive channel